jgi:LPXTG-site transpeptidase (sortase) family protein
MALRRVSMVLVGVFAALAVLVSACSGSEATEVVVSTPTATQTNTPTPTSTRTPTSTPVAIPTEDPEAEVVRGLQEFLNEYGYPGDAEFARLRIPTLGVDSLVGSRFVGSDGVMAAPGGPGDVIWYDMSLWPGMGGAPGEGGNAIFSGHVNYAAYVPYADVNYRGQGVFSQIGQLSAGDIIEVEYGGETLRYGVVSVRDLAADGAGWAEVWSNADGIDSITLYTCGGEFDTTTREYSHRIVVRAQRL